jgi:YVTN family beta-propeller protein
MERMTSRCWVFAPSLLVLLATVLLDVSGVHAATCSPCVWVTNQLSTSISVIDTTSNAVIANIPAGQTPQSITVNPSGTRIYVSTHADGINGLVTVVDTSSYQILANIPVGRNPTGLAVNPAGTRLYVLNSGDNTMSVVDTGSNVVLGSPVPVATGPYDVIVSPDGTRLYISATNAAAVQMFDTTTNQQVGALISVGKAPAGLAQNPVGTRLYVADFVNNDVGIIDTAAHTVVGTASAGPGAIAVTRDPSDNHLYVANFGGGQGTTLSVINTANNALAATINVGTSPHGLAMNAAGTALYVANQRTNNVSVVDPSNNTVIATIPVDVSPIGVAIVYAGATTPPPSSPHIASAVNGRPVFNPGGTTSVASGDTVQFTVRVPNISVGSPADVRYYLNPNLQFLRASAGAQTGTICQPTTFSDPLPNGVQGEASVLKCSLADGSKPLVVTAKVSGTLAPRDDPMRRWPASRRHSRRARRCARRFSSRRRPWPRSGRNAPRSSSPARRARRRIRTPTRRRPPASSTHPPTARARAATSFRHPPA